MQILLRSDVDGVGRRGDVVTVSAGHARNFLLPKGLAVVASKGAIAQAEQMRRARDARDLANRQSADAVRARLEGSTISVTARAGNEGRLFGSVTAADVVAALAAQTGVEIDRRHVALETPIRSVGDHQVRLDLHPEVTADVTVSVSAE
jgi:large subunit ribosomal protein L9